MDFTHKTLCQKAAEWLKRPNYRQGHACSFAFSETAPQGAGEIPDAIGWHYGVSVLIEAKTSRADYLADAKKPHRLEPHTGMGTYRYFLAPEGIISVDELPPRWGLLEINKRGHIKPRAGKVLLHWDAEDVFSFTPNKDAELFFLVRMLSRVADPEKTHRELQAAQGQAARFMQLYEKQRKECDSLQDRLWRLQYEARQHENNHVVDNAIT